MRTTRWLRTLGRTLGDDDRGVAAIEFAIVAPVLALGLIAATDLGFAEYERMTMDHTLRAAAQYAMTDPGVAAVCQRIQSLAGASYSVSCNGGAGDLTANVKRYCACPDALTAEVTCSVTCGGEHTYIFYRLTGTMKVTSNIVPSRLMDLASSVQVQTR
jgi:pilus assembly protein CpaE